MDARGPMEARLLGVERGLNAMDRDLETLERQIVALSQGIWDAWSDVATGNFGPPPPLPPPTVLITPCSGLNVLYNLPFTDSIFGSGTVPTSGTVNGSTSRHASRGSPTPAHSRAPRPPSRSITHSTPAAT